jgi:hypothetical protein
VRWRTGSGRLEFIGLALRSRIVAEMARERGVEVAGGVMGELGVGNRAVICGVGGAWDIIGKYCWI